MTGNQDLAHPLSLYFHLPFCSRKCPYCHFYVTKHTQEKETELIDALILELDSYKDQIKERRIPSVYFGGGTPSKLRASSIEKLLTALWKIAPGISNDTEITFEANPEDLSLSYLKAIRSLGINRLSIGVQSLSQSSLTIIQRTHNAEKAIQGIETAHQSGFDNISIDLMYDLPNQSLQSWKQTIQKATKLPITHISLYNLVIEENSAYARKRDQIEPLMPKDDESLAMLSYAIDQFEENGFKRYEISAFSKPLFQSNHNTGYWLAREFIGFGPSAFSYLNQSRFKNVSNLNEYIKKISQNQSAIDFQETLNPEDHQKELFLVQLRMKSGVPKLTFDKMNQSFQAGIYKQQSDGMIRVTDQCIQLTKKGMLFYDSIASELI